MSQASAGTPVPPGPARQVGVGVIVPYDMALDREMWRWAPESVSLHFTRTPYAAMPVTVEMAEHVGDAAAIQAGVRDLQAVSPQACAYACTSGSFVKGVGGERALRQSMVDAGAPRAVTTSGALLAALEALGARRVSIATPYDPQVTQRLSRYLQEAGVSVDGSGHLGLTSDIWTVPYSRTVELVLGADSDAAEAVVVSCTNLATYDIIAPLEERLGKPVVTANAATMWAALGAVGEVAVGPGQRLCAAPVPV
jgi:maleate isomerase